MKKLSCFLLVFLLLTQFLAPVMAKEEREPVESIDFTDLAETNAPTGHTASTNSTEYTEPALPTDFTEPAEPTDYTGPTEYTESPEPTVYTEPELPTDPTEPEDPADPTEPEEPRPEETHSPYVTGMSDGGFYPYATLTRAELAVIIYSQGDYPDGPNRFPDVKAKAWYGRAVNALAAAGVLGGFTDGTFRPNAVVSRAEVVAILASASGETATTEPSFTDVTPKHWAYGAIALAQEKGWAAGYNDGSFRPGQPVLRAEIVVMVNNFLGRVPDTAAIALGEGLRYFPDVQKKDWFYPYVMEAATPHTAHYETSESPEAWLEPCAETPTVSPDGFYCFGKSLFVVENGSYLREARTGTLNGVSYTCKGASGICTAPTEVLMLAKGELILLSKGKPLGPPGSYEDGFYLKAGQLYVAQEGKLLHQVGSGTLEGVSYSCTGESGVCTVADWRELTLPGVDLSVFAQKLTQEATESGTDSLTVAQLLRAAVRLYEAYCRVEYPLTEGSDEAYIEKALEYGILLSPREDYDAAVQRGDAAIFLWRALRGRELEAVNSIEGLPDVSSDEPCYPYMMDLYKAGVVDGFGTQHNAQIHGSISANVLAVWLKRLERPSERVRFTVTLKVVQTIQYGTSGSGRYPLTAYQIGNGRNVMILGFALHGWEDNWNRDGAELVYLADQLKAYLESNYDLVKNNNWTVYILRCMNPDGLYLGTTCNGPGRCTTTYLNSSGQLLTNKGIDMNRCFPYSFKSYTDSRNFNGTAPLQSVESRAIANFVQSHKGSGFNILVDTHGWYNQIITSNGTGTVYSAFHKQFTSASYASLYGARGYFSSWAAYVQGYDSCLLELPSGIYDHNSFLSKGCVWRFENAIVDLLQHYNGPNSTRNDQKEPAAAVTQPSASH